MAQVMRTVDVCVCVCSIFPGAHGVASEGFRNFFFLDSPWRRCDANCRCVRACVFNISKEQSLQIITNQTIYGADLPISKISKRYKHRNQADRSPSTRSQSDSSRHCIHAQYIYIIYVCVCVCVCTGNGSLYIWATNTNAHIHKLTQNIHTHTQAYARVDTDKQQQHYTNVRRFVCLRVFGSCC